MSPEALNSASLNRVIEPSVLVAHDFSNDTVHLAIASVLVKNLSWVFFRC